ncbi:MAG: hypothetical protein ABSH56_15155 [Bryobacteraceae bacterium]
MPFFLYRIEEDHFVHVRSNVVLAGLNGPFCCAARRVPTAPEWELSENALVSSYGVDPENHAVIIDLAPRRKTVSLYRLKHVWGHSANEWTQLALELEGLCVDDDPPLGVTPAEFKHRFPVLRERGDRIYEFLYVNGDGQTGSWSFGRVGGVNAPLLWEDVFDSFLKRINRKRRDIDGVPPLGSLD